MGRGGILAGIRLSAKGVHMEQARHRPRRVLTLGATTVAALDATAARLFAGNVSGAGDLALALGLAMLADVDSVPGGPGPRGRFVPDAAAILAAHRIQPLEE